MALTTLQQIREKVRQVTRSPSPSQLTDAQIDQKINTFIENYIPTSVKLFSLRTVLTFYTQPGVDVYQTNTTDPLDPLFNFKNRYTAVHSPAFIAGVAAYFTQQRDVFYGNWPQTNFVQQTGLFGNGTPGPFVGILPPPLNSPTPFSTAIPHILQKSVVFSCLDNNGTSMIVVDTPISNVIGNLTTPNSAVVLGTVNYVTGAFTVNFPANTAILPIPQNNPVWSEAIYYAPGLPTTILYYDNKFTLRPVPDKTYVIQVEANIRPVELLAISDVPQITQWWLWIAYGASRYVFIERGQYEDLNLIQIPFKEEEGLCLSTSMEQYTNQRTVTFYTNNGVNSVWNNTFNRWPY